MTIFKAVYDLRKAPVSFDFVFFLVAADCARQLAGCDIMNIIIRAGEYRKSGVSDDWISKEEKDRRIKGVLMPLARCVPSVGDCFVVDNCDNQEFDFPKNWRKGMVPYKQRDIFPLYERGANPKCFNVDAYADIDYDITLSPRQSFVCPERNANLDDWYDFYCKLDNSGYSVVVIPDLYDLEGEQRFFEYDWNLRIEPAKDLFERFRFYSGAKMNITSHASQAMLIYSDYPFLQFDQTRGNVWTQQEIETMNGYRIGEQLPWFNDSQCFSWVDSNADTLWNEFQKVMHS